MAIPTREDRLRHRDRPPGPAVMYQSWQQLLFLHWQVPVQTVQASLPTGLTVDTYQGQAWVGVVPFWMRNIRPRGCPRVPGISNFLELNLRTYVHDENGNVGVWFYSLDANQRLAVWTARTFFHLNYQRAEMESSRDPNTGQVDFRTRRIQQGTIPPARFRYCPTTSPAIAPPGTFEFFLIERYMLFARDRGGQLWTGRVFHPPYPLQSVALETWSDQHFLLNGLPAPNRVPDHVVMSPGVDVEIFGIQRQKTPHR